MTGAALRGPVRPPAGVRRRARAVHRRLGGVRARPRHRLADRGPCRAGPRCGDGDAAGDVVAQRGLPAARSGPGRSGIFSGLTGLAVLAGPVVGGAVAQGLAWQWIFWLNVPIGLVAHPVGARPHPGELRTRAARIDVGGLALVTARRARARLGPGARPTPPAGAARGDRRPLAAGAVLAVAFVVWELRARRSRWCRCASSARAAFSRGQRRGLPVRARCTAPLFFMAQFLQTALGYGPLGAGPAAAAVDGHAVHRRAVRRRAGEPVRRAAADRRGSAAAGRRDGLDRADRSRRR